MASQIVDELRARLRAQLHGMESFMERSAAPGRSCRLFFEPGWTPGPVLFSFARTDPPVIEVKPGQVMTLRQFEHASIAIDGKRSRGPRLGQNASRPQAAGRASRPSRWSILRPTR